MSSKAEVLLPTVTMLLFAVLMLSLTACRGTVGTGVPPASLSGDGGPPVQLRGVALWKIVYAGPSTAYATIDHVSSTFGMELVPLGRGPYGEWMYMHVLGEPTRRGWVHSAVTTVSADRLAALPRAAFAPLPCG